MSNKVSKYPDTPYELVASIRLRPGMYIGDVTSKGMHQILLDWICYRIQELADRDPISLQLELLPDGACRLTDNGNSLLDSVSSNLYRPALQAIFTQCGTVNSDRIPFYGRERLDGIETILLNALSIRLVATMTHAGAGWKQEFVQGIPLGNPQLLEAREKPSTELIFWPDPSIFVSHPPFDSTAVESRLRELVSLHPGLTIDLVDYRPTPAINLSLYSPQGIADLFEHLYGHEDSIHAHLFTHHFQDEIGKVSFVAQWIADNSPENCRFFINDFELNSGTHITGFRRALTSTFNRYAQMRGQRSDLAGIYYRSGLRAIFSITLTEPMFMGPTKSCLGNPEIEGWVQHALNTALHNFLLAYPEDAHQIYSHAFQAYESSPKQSQHQNIDPMRG